jgi:hypothetical protein
MSQGWALLDLGPTFGQSGIILIDVLWRADRRGGRPRRNLSETIPAPGGAVGTKQNKGG